MCCKVVSFGSISRLCCISTSMYTCICILSTIHFECRKLNHTDMNSTFSFVLRVFLYFEKWKLGKIDIVTVYACYLIYCEYPSYNKCIYHHRFSIQSHLIQSVHMHMSTSIYDLLFCQCDWFVYFATIFHMLLYHNDSSYFKWKELKGNE